MKNRQSLINKILVNEFLKYKQKPRKERGLPVLAFALVDGIVIKSFTNTKVEKGKNNKNTHAEHLLIEWIKEQGNKYTNIVIYSTLSPCNHCRIELEAMKEITSVTFILKNLNDLEEWISEKIKPIMISDKKDYIEGFHQWNNEIIGHQNRIIKWKSKNKNKIIYECTTLTCNYSQTKTNALVTLNETKCLSQHHHNHSYLSDENK